MIQIHLLVPNVIINVYYFVKGFITFLFQQNLQVFKIIIRLEKQGVTRGLNVHVTIITN